MTIRFDPNKPNFEHFQMLAAKTPEEVAEETRLKTVSMIEVYHRETGAMQRVNANGSTEYDFRTAGYETAQERAARVRLESKSTK